MTCWILNCLLVFFVLVKRKMMITERKRKKKKKKEARFSTWFSSSRSLFPPANKNPLFLPCADLTELSRFGNCHLSLFLLLLDHLTMVRTTTTSRLVAFTHLSPLSLHRAHLPATTPTTFIQQAAYSTRKHVPDSVKNNAKNNNSIGNNSPTRVGTHASQHTPSRQHGKGEPSALNRRAHYSPAKSKQTTTLRRPPPPPPKEYRQEELVADQSINEPLPESQIRMTSQEPSRPAPATPLPRVHRSWDHATRELSYKPGYRNAEKHVDRSLRADVMKASTSQQIATRCSRNNANSSGKHELGRSNSTSSVVENVYPTNFWTVPDTERVSRPILLLCDQCNTEMFYHSP